MMERRHRSFTGDPLWGDESNGILSRSSIAAPLRQAWGSRPLVCPGCLLRFRDEASYVQHWYTANERENAIENAERRAA